MGMFFKSLERRQAKEKAGPWDIVFFTGDLVGNGNEEEFAMLNEELDKLWRHLDKICGKKPVLLCVPGNHDLQRPTTKVKNSPAFIAFKRWNEEPKVQDTFWNPKNKNNDYRKLVNNAFTNYKYWFENCDFIPRGELVLGSIPGDFSYSTEINGIKLGVVGLNSAFLHIDDVTEGELALHRNQIQRLFDDKGVASGIDEFCGKHHVNILLTHHPDQWLHRDCEFKNDIRRYGLFQMHLFGHVHKYQNQSISTYGRPSEHIVQGHSLFSLLKLRDTATKRQHGYISGKIEINDNVSKRLSWAPYLQKDNNDNTYAFVVKDIDNYPEEYDFKVNNPYNESEKYVVIKPKPDKKNGEPSLLTQHEPFVNPLPDSNDSSNFKHSGIVWCVAFSPDGKSLASASSDAALWDVKSGMEIRTFKGHGQEVYFCAFSPDGKSLASASYDRTLKLWNVESGLEIHTFNGHKGWVNSCAFSPDGKSLASASWDQTLNLWDVESGEKIHTLKGHTGWVYSYAFSPDGKHLVSASGDRTLKLWDVGSGKKIHTFKGHLHSVYSCAFPPDGKSFASASYDKTLKLWDVESGKKICTFNGHVRSVNSCSFSPDGKHLASASSDKTLKLWDVESGREFCTFNGHKGGVNSCSFSPDGKSLASASEDKTLKLWGRW